MVSCVRFEASVFEASSGALRDFNAWFAERKAAEAPAAQRAARKEKAVT